jgi:hypothetical protein
MQSADEGVHPLPWSKGGRRDLPLRGVRCRGHPVNTTRAVEPCSSAWPTNVDDTGSLSASRFIRLYCFGDTRAFILALLIFTAPSGWCCCGVVITKFSNHAVTFRSSPTVVADTPMSGSASTRILPGKPPRAMWSAGNAFGLILHQGSSLFVQASWTDFCAALAAADPPSSVMNSRRFIRSGGGAADPRCFPA